MGSSVDLVPLRCSKCFSTTRCLSTILDDMACATSEYAFRATPPMQGRSVRARGAHPGWGHMENVLSEAAARGQ